MNEQAVLELKKKMSDPATFGIAKSFVMMGMDRGFDLSSEEGINKWMATYNAELTLTAGAGLPIPLPGERSEKAQQFRAKLQPRTTRNKRKKNRKRK